MATKKKPAKSDNSELENRIASENLFENIISQIYEFLESHNLPGFLIILGTKNAAGIMTYSNRFKNMTKEETDIIINDSIVKIENEFKPKYFEPLKLTYSKAEA